MCNNQFIIFKISNSERTTPDKNNRSFNIPGIYFIPLQIIYVYNYWAKLKVFCDQFLLLDVNMRPTLLKLKTDFILTVFKENYCIYDIHWVIFCTYCESTPARLLTIPAPFYGGMCFALLPYSASDWWILFFPLRKINSNSVGSWD